MKRKKRIATLLICILLTVVCINSCSFHVDESAGFNDAYLELIKNVILTDPNGIYKDVINGQIDDMPIGVPFDWSCSDISDRSLCYRLHGFTFLDCTYSLYLETNEERYKELIMSYMVDWVKSNPTVQEGNTWAWHDDATARRVFRFSYYLAIWKDDFAKKDYKLIYKSLKSQAELLATDEFYTFNHNHGMFQDIGLIAYALLIADEKTSERYMEIAKKRSNAYFDYVFTPDGVHKEHSPAYHITVSNWLLFFAEAYELRDPEFSHKMRQLNQNTAEFVTALIMPDGTLPSIGDSARKIADPAIYSTDEYKYACTMGKEGVAASNEYVSVEGGYVVMRSGWSDPPEEATYILFMASTHSSTHKHGDDLSFILYHGGDLFVEAGNRDYNYTNEMTAYAYSGFAHNVLIVNNEAYPVKFWTNGAQGIYPEALETHITDYNLESDIKYVEGEQIRFAEVHQQRRITYDKAKNTVKIDDVLIPTGGGSTDVDNIPASLIYHLAEGVELEQKSDGWILLRDGRKVATVTMKSEEADLSLSAITEEQEFGSYHTWIFEGNTSPQYGSLLKVDFQVTEKTNVQMEIVLED